ncbi:hypothetical protein ACIP5U_39090 [Streptomyces sp. NPDC088788]|uniref:hypothetical protein n=1 Tax=Streptomyces sp. NPDC088788 TaxID=3365898 RepID=UPI0037F15FF7
MTSNSSKPDAQQGGAAASGPFIIENNVAYLRASFSLAPTAGPIPPYVVIDGTPYLVVQSPVPSSTSTAPTVPVSPANLAAPAGQAPQAEAAVSAEGSTATPADLRFPFVPGQFHPMLPVPDPQTALPADPMSAALNGVISNVTPPSGQLPPPSWAAVTVFTLLLGAVITFTVLGIEVGVALGTLALVGMVAGYTRRVLA